MKVSCPDCNAQNTFFVGILPDSHEFAGESTDFVIPGGRLFKCAECALKFRFPILDSNKYNQLYDVQSQNWIFDNHRNDWKLIVDFVQKNVYSRAKILDFGCNYGDILAQIPNEFEKFGIEIKREAKQSSLDKGAKNIWIGFEEIPTDFLLSDLIYSVDVIEHLPSPRGFLIEAQKYVKKGGFVALMSGDSNCILSRLSKSKWWYCFYPEHISFISKLWAAKIASDLPQYELVFQKKYFNNSISFSKRLKWFFVWIINFAAPQIVLKYLLKFPKIKQSAMFEKKNFGRNIFTDHIFVVFRKISE